MSILNKPTEGQNLLQANYDKLLHTSVSFMLLSWIDKLLVLANTIENAEHAEIAIFVWFCMCLFKIAFNAADRDYKPLGDILADLAGLCLWIVWLCI